MKIAHRLHPTLCSHTSTPSCLPFPHIHETASTFSLSEIRQMLRLTWLTLCFHTCFGNIFFFGEPLLSYKYIILGVKRVATTSSKDILIRGHFIHNLHGISLNHRCPSREGRSPLGIYSLSGKTSYRKISWSLEAARFGFGLFRLLWNLTGISAACKISERYDHYNTQSRGFETSRDWAVRRLTT